MEFFGDNTHIFNVILYLWREISWNSSGANTFLKAFLRGNSNFLTEFFKVDTF